MIRLRPLLLPVFVALGALLVPIGPFRAAAQTSEPMPFGAILTDHPLIGALGVYGDGSRMAVLVERGGEEIERVTGAYWRTPDGDGYLLQIGPDGDGFRLSGAEFLLDIAALSGDRADLTLTATDGSSQTFADVPLDAELVALVDGWTRLYRQADLLGASTGSEMLVALAAQDPLEVTLLSGAALASLGATLLTGATCVAGFIPTLGVAATGALPLALAATAKLTIVCTAAAGSAYGTGQALQQIYIAVTDPEARAEAIRHADRDLTLTAISLGADAGEGATAVYVIESAEGLEGIRHVARTEAHARLRNAGSGIVATLAAEGITSLADEVTVHNDTLRRAPEVLEAARNDCTSERWLGYWEGSYNDTFFSGAGFGSVQGRYNFTSSAPTGRNTVSGTILVHDGLCILDATWRHPDGDTGYVVFHLRDTEPPSFAGHWARGDQPPLEEVLDMNSNWTGTRRRNAP